MKHEMDFETLDWQLEARRVKAAFAVEEECAFLLIHHGWGDAKVLRPTEGKGRTQSHGMRLTAHYEPTSRHFLIQGPLKLEKIEIVVAWNNNMAWIQPPPYKSQPMNILVEGLSNLGLLTPEIEATMQLSISHHQKLEWALEYEARLQL